MHGAPLLSFILKEAHASFMLFVFINLYIELYMSKIYMWCVPYDKV